MSELKEVIWRLEQRIMRLERRVEDIDGRFLEQESPSFGKVETVDEKTKGYFLKAFDEQRRKLNARPSEQERPHGWGVKCSE